MTRRCKKWTAILLAGLLACTALVGCDEEKDAETTKPTESAKPAETTKDQGASTPDDTEKDESDGTKWDGSAYIGLTPEKLYEALETAEEYEVVIQEYDGATLCSVTQAIVDGDIVYYEYSMQGAKMYMDYAERTGYMNQSGEWIVQKAPDDYEMPKKIDEIIGSTDWLGLGVDELFADSNYDFNQSQYTMTSTFLDEWNEEIAGKVHYSIMKSTDTKYVFSIERTITESNLKYEITIEFKPTSLTLPTVN